MATLTGQTIASSYEQLLHTDTNGGGNGNTLVTIKDGDNGTTFGLKLATNKVKVIPSAANDANAFEVSQADGTAVFTVNSSTVGATLIGTLTVGADDAGHDVIFYGDTASSNMTWDTSADDLVLNDSRLFINQDDNSVSIDIDSEATTEPVIQVDSPASTTHPIINLTNLDSLTTGEGLRVHSNSSDTNTRYLTYLINDHSSATGTRVLYLKQDAAQTAMFVDQGADGIGIDIDTESTTKQAIRIIDPKTTTGKVVSIEECDGLTTGKALYVHSNSSSNGSRILTHIVNDHASAVNTIPLKIQQDSLNVVVAIDDPKTTADNIMQITNADALTSGGMLYLESGSTSTGSRKLLHVVNSNSLATGSTVLHLHQTAGCECLVIDQDGNSNAIYIDGENTTTPAINVICDALTSGEGLRVYSNSGDSSNRNLVEIINDHASADNTRGLYIQNDGALYGIEMAGGCGIRFDSTVASADASTLDDYEEGTITPSMSGATSHPTNTFQARGGKYTKIGDRCYWSIRVEMNGSGITPGSGTLSVDGLPFTVLSDDNNQGGISVGHTANWLTGQHGAPTGGFYNTNSTAFFLVVYDNDAGNIAGMSYADAADVDDSTTFTASGHYKVA